MKVSLLEITEIKISHLFKTSVEELTKMEAISSDPQLFWCNGILFSATENNTDSVSKKIFDGLFLIDSFSYALSEKITVSKWNGYSVEVIDTTGHTSYDAVTKAIQGDSL